MARRASFSRSLRSLLVFALAALLSALAFATEILEVSDSSLTSYLAGRTNAQDVRPLHRQRGVNLDGSLREGGAFPLAIAGNPFERAWHGDMKNNGVSLDTGAWSPTEIDLSLPAPGPRWSVGRSYNAVQDDAGHFSSDGYQGRNWFQLSQPEIVLYDAATDADDVLYLVWGADRYAEFRRTGSGSLVYKGKNGAAGCFLYSSGSPDTWAYTDQNGTVFTFFGFNTSSGRADGQIWKIEDPAGNKAYVGDATTASTAATNGYYSDGRMDKAFDSADRRYTYSYSAVDSVNRLTEVKAETKSGGTWASPTGVAEVGRVEYSYYTSSDSNGDSGDLRTVKVTLPLSDSGINEVRVQYMRYWEGAFNASTNPGYPHHIKLLLDWEGTRKFDYTGDATFDDDFLTETTDNLKPYAAAYLEYDSSHRVDLAWFSGQCGCGGAGTGTHEYRYETNGSYSDNSGYDTAWCRRTSIERPDGTWLTQYFDETGQPLSRVRSDIDPASTDPVPNYWVDHVQRDEYGAVEFIGTPANASVYDHDDGAITASESAGLVWIYDRDTSGNDAGFLLDSKYQQGTGGTAYLERSYTWDVTTAIKEIGSSTGIYVRRPLMTGDRVYSQAVTSGTTGSYLTTYAYTTYSGASPTSQPLAIEEITTTQPAVATGNNGSNSTYPSKIHLRKDGREDFEGRADGSIRIIEYTEYTNGLVTKHNPDANTSSLSPPTNLSHIGTPIDPSTTYTFDAQGRADTTTEPSGRVSKLYHSILKDRRLVTLSYPKYVSGGTPTYYGPVGYSVRNHAGKAEVQGVIAFSGGSTTTGQSSHIDETDDDPIAAVDTGTVAQMRTSHFDESGTQLEEERAYFAIPASEPGTDGTHYDPTTYGYDDLGRRRRVKEAHGTITRIVYDALGRQTARWIGTCDSSWAGGQGGTDNMVKIEETTFDSGSAGGNSLVTKRTLYVQDSDTNKRETTFSNDLRGNVVLATNPQAPHIFYKYDNMDRAVAVGGFSSTANIVVGTDDPTTETSNRVSLSQSFYDELGRAWKEQRHKIDVSDGSDDDNLQSLSWFDPFGRLVKRDGGQLEKYFYDRLDRQTHHFTLVNDNDSSYGDVDDVAGDIVVVEDQTTFDVAGETLMQARIERLHDDYSSGETLGALDTNADTDSLLYTAANLEGRIQISAMWYDALDRLQDRVEYGTNGGSNFDRDGLSVPSRSDTALRTTYTYNDDGTLKEVEDPKGLKTRTEYDALGRRTKVIANYTDGTPGGGTYSDQDQTVAYAYTDGLQTSITADLPSGETDQVTSYLFGTTKGTSAGDSKIATGHLLQKVTYPDSTSGTDVVTFAYNAQSQQIWKKDQAGNIIETDFDTAGRETHRRVTTLDGDFDGAVRRISRTYNSRGLSELVTQYDNATVGSGSVVDEVKYSYEEWAQLSKFEQDRNSAVGAGGSVDDYEVSYVWEKATTGRNTLRRYSLTLPSGNVLEYKYRSTANLHDAEVSRVTQIGEGATALVTYQYNGLDTVVGTTLDEPDVMSKQFGSTSGSYPDLDRFDRVTTSKWTKDLTNDVDFYKVDLAYDRNSNIVSAEDQVHTGFDVLYTNDSLNRLVRADEGTLSGGSITSRKRDQQWTLTQTGNWEIDKVDLNGDGDFVDASELNDDRTHNAVNELTARDTDDNGTDNYSFTYDEAGNLTDDGESYKYEWDAFYRLRKVKNRSTLAVVAEYKYNGLGYRISIHEDTDSDGDVDGNDKWFHHAFDERWRWVATYRESDSSPKEEYLHQAAGLDGHGTGSYIDLVIFRDRDINSGWTSAGDGTMEERLYYCQNWRADVSAIATRTGQMKEWVKYSTYGVPFGLPGADANSDGDCDAADMNQIDTWIESGPYDVRGDVDLNALLEETDLTLASSDVLGTTLGRGNATGVQIANSKGFAGYELLNYSQAVYGIRRREVTAIHGRWSSRDDLAQAVHLSNINLYEYSSSKPIISQDPSGRLHTEVKGTHGAFCGGSALLISPFKLDNTPKDLCPSDEVAIIQEMSIGVKYDYCLVAMDATLTGHIITFPGANTSDHYWEFIGVLSGEDKTLDAVDMWGHPMVPFSEGSITWKGETRAYCNEGSVKSSVSTWPTGGVAGANQSTGSEPRWWTEGSGVESPFFRNLYTMWDCCFGVGATWGQTTTPKQ
jgi:YD repeat-containing protein